jgi:uncharacterized protein (TIGR02001 family)
MNILKKIIFGSVLSLSSIIFSEVSLSGNIGLTTDYIWRGMTQNDGNPSISGGFDLEDDSGFYLGVWAANVEADDDDTVAGSGSIELDGYLGYSGSFNENAGYDFGYIAYTYPDYDAWDFEELYITFDFYGVYVTYAGGIDTANDYGEIGYSIDAGPGSFSISYGEYDNMGSNYLVGYDWSVGDFTLGFYYSDFDSDAGVANDQDGGFFTISY